MAEDREMLKEIWAGKIPVSFELSEEDVDCDAEQLPEPCLFLVPRLTYFPLVLDKVRRYLHRFTKAPEDALLWLEHDDRPLRWQYPVGVLFDLLTDVGTADDDLPWRLTVHFQNFPDEEVLHLNCKEAIEAHYMHTLKEADALKHRGRIVSDMQRRDHKQLWQGLSNDRFDQFWLVNRKLMESGASASGSAAAAEDLGGSEDLGGFRYIPFRIYQRNKPIVQRLCKPLAENGAALTVEDLLRMCVPSAAGSPDNAANTEDLMSRQLLTHGIVLPRDTPLQWLSEHLSYPDNFLHLCLL